MDYSDIPFEDCTLGDEGEMLLFALDRVHRQFAWKSGGLDAEQLRRQHAPSELTIAGTIVHLAKVEEQWTALAAERPVGPPVLGPDGSEHYDAEWTQEITLTPEELYDLWYSTIGRYREEWGHLVAGSGLGTVLHSDPGYVATRRRRLVDILEENLQHTGQISVIREAVDGLVGNDPP
ncbi:mycothiol transferase [Brachybacterium sp. AOP3-A1-3]|uniref:mycothiol transferase n=1 Tax=Brachybacterium sp. AOP3-A1-3 TaxID=3457699 RepID=UPI0040344928